MNNYAVEIIETLVKTFVVKSEDEESAKETIKKLYEEEIIVLDWEDYCDSEIVAYEIEEKETKYYPLLEDYLEENNKLDT